MLDIGIYIQSPLLQKKTLEAPRNSIFPIDQRKGFVVGFFPVFLLQLFEPFLNENLYYQKKKLYKLGNNTTNMSAVLNVALKALLITKMLFWKALPTVSESQKASAVQQIEK